MHRNPHTGIFENVQEFLYCMNFENHKLYRVFIYKHHCKVCFEIETSPGIKYCLNRTTYKIGRLALNK